MRRKPIPPVVRVFVTRICTVFWQFCPEGITFSGRSRPSDFVGDGERSSRTWDKEGPGLKNIFFRPFGCQFGLKIRGAQAPSLWSATDMYLVPLHTQLWVMNKISNNFHQRAVTIIYFSVIFAGVALKLHGCHYGPGGGGFSLTTMMMTAGYFHRKQNENETKRTLWLFSSPPAYCTNCKYA